MYGISFAELSTGTIKRTNRLIAVAIITAMSIF